MIAKANIKNTEKEIVESKPKIPFLVFAEPTYDCVGHNVDNFSYSDVHKKQCVLCGGRLKK